MPSGAVSNCTGTTVPALLLEHSFQSIDAIMNIGTAATRSMHCMDSLPPTAVVQVVLQVIVGKHGRFRVYAAPLLGTAVRIVVGIDHHHLVDAVEIQRLRRGVVVGMMMTLDDIPIGRIEQPTGLVLGNFARSQHVLPPTPSSCCRGGILTVQDADGPVHHVAESIFDVAADATDAGTEANEGVGPLSGGWSVAAGSAVGWWHPHGTARLLVQREGPLGRAARRRCRMGFVAILNSSRIRTMIVPAPLEGDEVVVRRVRVVVVVVRWSVAILLMVFLLLLVLFLCP